MQEAFAAVEAALMVGNVSKVASDFGCCQTPKNLHDQVNEVDRDAWPTESLFTVEKISSPWFQIELMQNLADVFMGVVQYNEEGVFMSVSDLCEVMTDKNGTCDKGTDAYNRLVKLSQVFNTHLLWQKNPKQNKQTL